LVTGSVIGFLDGGIAWLVTRRDHL